MTTFNELGITTDVIKAMKRMKWRSPTPIQEETVPEGLLGHDIIAKAQTGSGKTGAFGSVILSRIGTGYRTPSAIVLVPTRELAIQICGEMEKMASFTGHRCSALYGGTSLPKQIAILKGGTDVVICTPGRARDLLEKQALKVSKISVAVIDEADRMFDMGLADGLNFVLSRLPKKRQTMMFSATFPEKVKKLAQSILKDPAEIMIDNTETPGSIRQFVIETESRNRIDSLRRILSDNPCRTIVFCNTIRATSSVFAELRDSGFQCHVIHGDLPQDRRETAVRKFSEEKNGILVATDVAARGLDIADVKMVVNYDIPESDVYVHRIGRTGRAGAKGTAITFTGPGTEDRLKEIEAIAGKLEPYAISERISPDKEPSEARRTKNDSQSVKEHTEKKNPRKKAEKAEESKITFSTISINIGTDDGMEEADVRDFILSGTGIGGKRVGKISVKDGESVVKIDSQCADDVCEALSEYDLDGRPVESHRI